MYMHLCQFYGHYKPTEDQLSALCQASFVNFFKMKIKVH